MGAHSRVDGKALEDLVARIESLLVPQGFTVPKNRREYNDNGVAIGEFDITIHGNVGSTPISCLIECRNRPSAGPAPASWIQQLVGRRRQFGFDKVIAVSTTGFAAGAEEFAGKEGVDLREMSQLIQLPPDLASWLGTRILHSREVRHTLNAARLHIGEHETPERERAATTLVSRTSSKAPFLRETKTGQMISVVDAFQVAVQQQPELYSGLVPNGSSKHVKFVGNYRDDEDHYVLDTPVGPVRVTGIEFEGELSIIQTDVPLEELSEYRRIGNKDAISQTASFALPVRERIIKIDLHHLTQSGQTCIAIEQTEVSPNDPMPKKPKGRSTRRKRAHSRRP